MNRGCLCGAMNGNCAPTDGVAPASRTVCATQGPSPPLQHHCCREQDSLRHVSGAMNGDPTLQPLSTPVHTDQDPEIHTFLAHCCHYQHPSKQPLRGLKISLSGPANTGASVCCSVAQDQACLSHCCQYGHSKMRTVLRGKFL